MRQRELGKKGEFIFDEYRGMFFAILLIVILAIGIALLLSGYGSKILDGIRNMMRMGR
jgi:hypothetical protein